MARNWTRDELILVMNLYCRLPFGKFHRLNPDVIQMGSLIGRTPSAVAMKLSNLASLDSFHSDRGVKGLSGASSKDREIWLEFHADWETLAVESELLLNSRLQEETVNNQDLLATYQGETTAERTTTVRLAQGFFRKTVLASYESQCCVTGLTIPSLLVASHILPWSDFPEHRVNPCNGLCLNNLFDKAFDRGLIAFDEDQRLMLSREITSRSMDEAVSRYFLPYTGARLKRPSKFQPLDEFLAKHREILFLG